MSKFFFDICIRVDKKQHATKNFLQTKKQTQNFRKHDSSNFSI